jgi:integrase/recombinase XerD
MANLFVSLRKLFKGSTAASPSPRVSDLIDGWCQARIADGNQDRGVERYRQQLVALVKWAGDDLRVDAFTRRLIADYKTSLGSRTSNRRRRDGKETRITPGTTRNALTAIRAFGEWCVERELLADNPAMAVSHPKVQPPPPNVLTRAQIFDLLRVIDTRPYSHRDTWQRNRLVVLLILYAGLRREELAQLCWGDIDFARRELTIRRAKGGKSRTVPICHELLTELKSCGPQLFANAVIGNADGMSIGHAGVGKVFERWLPCRWQRVTSEAFPGVGPHQLRRTFATELYVRGADLFTIQRLLGHSDPKTTLRYIAASSEMEHAAVERLRFRKQPDENEEEVARTAVDRLQLRSVT